MEMKSRIILMHSLENLHLDFLLNSLATLSTLYTIPDGLSAAARFASTFIHVNI